MCQSSLAAGVAMLTWSTSRSALAGTGGSGRRTSARRSFTSAASAAVFAAGADSNQAVTRASGTSPAAADRRHLDGALLAVGQQKPIGRHQDRAEIDRMDGVIDLDDGVGLERLARNALPRQLDGRPAGRFGRQHDLGRPGIERDAARLGRLAGERQHGPADLLALLVGDQAVLGGGFEGERISTTASGGRPTRSSPNGGSHGWPSSIAIRAAGSASAASARRACDVAAGKARRERR